MKKLDWYNLLKKIEDQEEGGLLVSVLRQSRAVNLTDQSLTLECANSGVELYLKKRVTEIEALFSKHLSQNITVLFQDKQTTPTISERTPLLRYTPSSEDFIRKAGLNIKFTFDNFAVFSTNQIAYAAAQAIAEKPGSGYNPFFLWGGVGVGKTHLAHAIARSVIEKDPEKRVYYCPGDEFTNDLVESIRAKTTARFRKKYRDLDFLIIDDVQFIAGKLKVQEELFHTFNAIVSRGGQIILTSDKPPFEINNIEDRLRSRFSGGLIVDVQQPDFELRSAILLIKAREKNLEIDIEAAKIIAEKITDTRALEGTLLSIGAKIFGKKERIDLEAIEEYFLGEQSATKTQRRQASPTEVIRAIAAFYNIKPSHIRAATRVENIARARQIVMYVLREEFHLKLEEIAYILKRKDHTTILYGVNKIKSQFMKDAQLQDEINKIIQTLH